MTTIYGWTKLMEGVNVLYSVYRVDIDNEHKMRHSEIGRFFYEEPAKLYCGWMNGQIL